MLRIGKTGENERKWPALRQNARYNDDDDDDDDDYDDDDGDDDDDEKTLTLINKS